MITAVLYLILSKATPSYPVYQPPTISGPRCQSPSDKICMPPAQLPRLREPARGRR